MPKQDKVQRINQRRLRATDMLGVSGAGATFVPPGTCSMDTENSTGSTHVHELDIDLVELGHIVLLVASDGSTVDYGEAGDDELTAALAAATAGDVVLLPACEIEGDHTVPAGVGLVGRAWTSVLTGQLTLGAGAEARDLCVERDEDDGDEIYGVTTADAGDDAARLVACSVSVTNTGDAVAVTVSVVPLECWGCNIDAESSGGDGYGAWGATAKLTLQDGQCDGSTAPIKA